MNNKNSLWGNRGQQHEMPLFGRKRGIKRVMRPPQPPIPVRQPLQFPVENETIEFIVGNNSQEEDLLIAEQEARLKAEEEARLKAEEDARLQAEEEARLQAEEDARLQAEEEARLKAEEEARLKAEEEARLKAEEEARLQAEEEARLKAEEEARLKAEEEARLAEEEWQKNNLTPEEIEANKRYQAEEEETARILALEEEQKSEPNMEEVYEEPSISPGENLLSSNLDLSKASEEISENTGSEEEVMEKIEEEEIKNIKV